MIKVRPAVADDLELLWEFLAIAAYEPDVPSARAVPMVATHLAGWQRSTDFGVIAELNGKPIGATWARQFVRAEEPVFFLDEHTPEISVGVLAEERGQGVGDSLITALIAEARRRGVGLCLNVRDTNRASRLYERLGFRFVEGSDVPNRVGGLSRGMVLDGPG